METKKCKYCQSEIDNKAKICPNCKKDLRNWFIRHWFVSFFLISVFIGIISSTNQEYQKISDQVEKEAAQKQKIEEEKAEEAKLTPEQIIDRQINSTNEIIQNNLNGFSLNEIKKIIDKNNSLINEYGDLEKSKELIERNSKLNNLYTEKEIELNSKWSYSETKDEMDGKISYFASNISTNSVDFEFPYNGGSNFTLTVRNSNNKNEILFSVSKGQFMGTYSGGKVRLKFDDNEPFYVSFNEPSDYSSDLIFLGSVPTIIASIKKSKKLLLEAEFFNEGKEIAEFDLSGFKWEH